MSVDWTTDHENEMKHSKNSHNDKQFPLKWNPNIGLTKICALTELFVLLSKFKIMIDLNPKRLISFTRCACAWLWYRNRYRQFGAIEAFNRNLDLLVAINRTALTLLVLLESQTIVFGSWITRPMAFGESANRFCIDAFAMRSFHLFHETDGFAVAQWYRQTGFWKINKDSKSKFRAQLSSN